jgi:hypothetical protein
VIFNVKCPRFFFFARCVTEHCDWREILVGATLRTLYCTVFKLGDGETTSFVSLVRQGGWSPLCKEVRL